ncbi:hypothetical protein GLOTRDRAFT_123056, partial [Gloeophyllum trabeum ATCC 11539]
MSNTTAETASQLSREARNVQQSLKELQKTCEPWAKEVEFQRKNLRRLYLRLLLLYPYAKETKDVETHLWMSTSHHFISQYKQRILALDRVVFGPPPRHGPRHQQGGPVEYRKLLSRFRQFLAEEERFWIQLVLRFQRTFGLNDAQPALFALGIASGEGEGQPEEGLQNGRNNLGFPPEDGSTDVVPQKSDQRKGQLFILAKALVCLGDLARYKELYNDGGGRPRAGHEDGPAAGPIRPPRGGRGRGRGGGISTSEQMPARERNYERAQRYYEQARLLVPDEGNASHQLAILSMYKKDTFGSLVHYYKALCVLQPYDPATGNMGIILDKALDAWRKSPERPPLTEPRHKVARLKEDVLILHALWRLGVQETRGVGPMHAEQLLRDFKDLVSERIVPPETIREVVILAQGALLKHRKFRDPPVSGHRRSRSSDPDHVRTASASTIESQIASHIIALHRTLMEVGTDELAEKPPEDAAEGDLAQKITAVFRRTLPALRIAGKWLRANIGYVTQRSAPRDNDGRRGRAPSVLIARMDDFWTTYTQFMSALLRTFPLEKLPALTRALEEDIDLAGFIPLKKYLMDRGTERTGGDEHPNDEQLMRIADILEDARSTAADVSGSPILLKGNQFLLRTTAAEAASEAPARENSSNGISDQSIPAIVNVSKAAERTDEDEVIGDAMTDVTRTDDDPVREAGDAFRSGLRTSSSEAGDDEDEIVWNPRPAMSPIAPPALSPVAPPALSPIGPPALSPIAPPVLSPRRPSALSPTGPTVPTALPSPPAVLHQSPARPNFATQTSLPQSPARIAEEPPSVTTPKSSVGQGMTAADLLNSLKTGVPLEPPQRIVSSTHAEALFGTGSR